LDEFGLRQKPYLVLRTPIDLGVTLFGAQSP
jgi:hypothetical protein